MTLTYQRFKAVLLLMIYGSVCLSGIYYCLRVFWCAAARMSELGLESQFAKTIWRGKMTFWAVSSQVIKYGSTNTTLKRSSKVHNGRLLITHDQKIPSVQIKSQNNVAVFFDIRGIVHCGFLPNLLFGSTGKAV